MKFKLDSDAPLMNGSAVTSILTHTQVFPFLHASRERTTFVVGNVVLLCLNLVLHVHVTVVHEVLIAVIFPCIPACKQLSELMISSLIGETLAVSIVY